MDDIEKAYSARFNEICDIFFAPPSAAIVRHYNADGTLAGEVDKNGEMPTYFKSCAHGSVVVAVVKGGPVNGFQTTRKVGIISNPNNSDAELKVNWVAKAEGKKVVSVREGQSLDSALKVAERKLGIGLPARSVA